MDIPNLLAELCGVSAPSGAESELAALLVSRWEPFCAQVRRDAVGNVIARVGGHGPRVLLQAHMDQVGYIVRFVHEDGFLLLDGSQGDRRTGPERRHPIGQPVRVLTRDGSWLDGMLAAASGHVLTAKQRDEHELSYNDFWVELGLGSRAAVYEAGVHVGSPVVFCADMRAYGDLLVGPSMDNRVGLALIEAVAGTVDESALLCDLWIAATVQEENGLHGARALALAERFDAAIAIDVGLAGDIPAVDEREFPTRLGAGPIVVHRDTGIVYDRLLVAHLLGLGVPAQDGLFAGYGSDGLAIAETGTPTALLTVATRYTHTAFETVHRADLDATAELLRAFVTRPQPVRPG
jgi:putative aminopeptidase FrvX